MSEHHELLKSEIDDIRKALDFFKGVLIGNGAMSISAASHYNAAMDAIKKLESQERKS